MHRLIFSILALLAAILAPALADEATTSVHELTLVDVMGADSACVYYEQRVAALNLLETELVGARETVETARASLGAREEAAGSIQMPTSAAAPNYAAIVETDRALNALVRTARTALHAAEDTVEVLEEAIVIATSNVKIAITLAFAYEVTECNGAPIKINVDTTTDFGNSES